MVALDPVRRDRQLARQVEQWYTDEYDQLVRDCDVIALAIKPQDFAAAAPQLRDALRAANEAGHAERGVISIMAGVSVAELSMALGTGRIVRMMPNIAARYGKAMVAMASAGGAGAIDDDFRTTAIGLGQRLGQVMEIAERYFDVFIALSGSGIAFVLQVIHALTVGGVENGLPAEASEKIVAQTVEGAVTTLLRSGRHPQELIRSICSAGGTTVAGVAALEDGGLNAVLMQAVRATVKRSQQLTGATS